MLFIKSRILPLLFILLAFDIAVLAQQIEWAFPKQGMSKKTIGNDQFYDLGNEFYARYETLNTQQVVILVLRSDLGKLIDDVNRERPGDIPDKEQFITAVAVSKAVVTPTNETNKFLGSGKIEEQPVYLYQTRTGAIVGASLSKDKTFVLLMPHKNPQPSTTDDGIDDEKTIKVLSYLLNGEAAARRHLSELRQLSSSIPYRPLVIVGISRQLLVWGWKDLESKKIIEACANAAAGVAADDDGFARIALLVGRLADSEESTYAILSNLEKEGIPAWQLTGYLIGKSVEQTKSLSLERRLKPKVLAEALMAGFNEKYAGAAERESKKLKKIK